MAKYSYKYSGLNAAFVFAGVATLPNGITVVLDGEQHEALEDNKFAKHLIESGELSVEEIADSEPKPTSGRGKGKTAKEAEITIDNVRKQLSELEITFAEDETLEQLQAKLAQAKE